MAHHVVEVAVRVGDVVLKLRIGVDQLRNDETVLRTMLHDIYQNGQVLQRKKYRFLSYAYRVFVVGLVATVVSFVIEMWMS